MSDRHIAVITLLGIVAIVYLLARIGEGAFDASDAVAAVAFIAGAGFMFLIGTERTLK